jgi:hypothetical protein
VVVTLDENGMGSLEASQILLSSYDNCGTVNLQDLSQIDFDCSDLGLQSVTLQADDGNGNTASCGVEVTILNDAPLKLEVKKDPIILWPPNHKYHTVSISDLVTSIEGGCNPPGQEAVKITRVSSDELEDSQGEGDGNTMDDIIIAPDCKSVDLRSERLGSGNGRVYTIELMVSDDFGNVATAAAMVHVPHDKNGQATNDGPIYSKEGCGEAVPVNVSSGNPKDRNLNIQVNAQLRSYPNPFTDDIDVQFYLPKESKVLLNIFDYQGRLVKKLIDDHYLEGSHRIKWNGQGDLGQNLPNGLYLVRLQHPTGTKVIKIIKTN